MAGNSAIDLVTQWRSVPSDERARRRRQWRWILGGFLAAMAMGSLFAFALQALGDWRYGLPWERTMLLRMGAKLSRPVDLLFLTVPWTGTNLTLMPVIFAGAWLINRKGRRDLAVQLVVVVVGCYALNLSLKALFDRPRPDLWPKRGQFAWASFPSGHALATISVIFTVAILLHRERGWRWPYALAAILLLINLYSRLYLGVHWPTDVIAGMLVGVVWLGATLAAFPSTPRQARRRINEGPHGRWVGPG